jgi:hypothetical protein
MGSFNSFIKWDLKDPNTFFFLEEMVPLREETGGKVKSVREDLNIKHVMW